MAKCKALSLDEIGDERVNVRSIADECSLTYRRNNDMTVKKLRYR